MGLCSLLCHEPTKRHDPPRRIKPDPDLNGLDDFAEHIVGNVFIWHKHDVPAVRGIGQPRSWFDLIRDLVESADILKHDFEVHMKIAGQFICPEDIESSIVGSRFG